MAEIDDALQRMMDMAAPSSNSAVDSYTQRQQVTPSVNPLSSFVHGLSFSLAGEAPTDTVGTVSEAVGSLVSFGIADWATGGLLSPLAGETTLGKLGMTAAKDAVLAGLQSGINPEDKAGFFKNFAFFAGADALIHIPQLYKIWKGVESGLSAAPSAGEAALQIGTKELEENVEKLFAGEFKTAEGRVTTALHEHITNLSTLHDELLNRQAELSVQAGDKYDEMIYGGGANKPQQYKEAREASRQAIRDTLTVSPELKDIFQLSGLSNEVIGADEILKITRGTTTQVIGAAGMPQLRVINPALMKEQLEELELKLGNINRKFLLGLKPDATIEQVYKAGEKQQQYREWLASTLFGDKTILDIRSKMTETLGKIIQSAPELPAEFQDLPEYIRFAQTSTALMRDEGTKLEAARARDIVEQAVKVSEKRTKAIASSVDSAFRNYDTGAIEQMNKYENYFSKGVALKPDSKELDRAIRPTLVRLIRNELVRLAPDQLAAVAGDEGAIDQFVKQFVQNPMMANPIIDNSGSMILKRAYTYYRASMGDPVYIQEARALWKDSYANLNKDLASKLVEHDPGQGVPSTYEPEKTLTGRYDDKPKGGLGGGGQPPPAGAAGGAGMPPPAAPGGITPNVEEAAKLIGQVPQVQPGEIQAQGGFGRFVPSGARRLFQNLPDMASTYANKATGALKDLFTNVHELALQYSKSQMNARRQLELDQHFWTDLDNRIVTALGKDGSDSFRNYIKDINVVQGELFHSKAPLDYIAQTVAEKVNAMPNQWRPFYNEYRNRLDEAYFNKVTAGIANANRFIELGVAKGKYMDYIGYIHGYAPVIYNGDWVIKGENGVEYFAHTEEDAFMHLKQMVQQRGQTGKIYIEPRGTFNGDEIRGISPAFYEQVTKTFTHETDSLRAAINDGYLKPDTLREYMFGGLYERGKGLAAETVDPILGGYIRDISATKFYHYYPLNRISDTYKDAMFQQGLGQWADILKTHADDLLGRSRGLEATLDRYIKSSLEFIYGMSGGEALMNAVGMGRDSRPVRSINNGLRFMARMASIGFNPMTSIINELIVMHNVAPMAGFRNTTQGILDIGKIWKYVRDGERHEYSDVFDKLNLDMIAHTKSFRDTINPSEFAGDKPKRWMNWFDGKMMSMFSGSEKYAKGIAAISFTRQAKQMAEKGVEALLSGNKQERLLADIANRMGRTVGSREVIAEYAARMTNNTTFNFNSAHLPELFRNPVAAPFLQFKTYWLNQMQFMFGLAKNNPMDLFKVTGMMAALGGAFALPGVEEADAISRKMFGFSPKAWAENSMGAAVTAGIPALAGIDVSSRVNFGSLFRFMDTGSISGIYPETITRALGAITQGHPEMAAAYMTPAFIRNLQQAYELYSTGQMTSPYERGAVVVPPTENVSGMQILARAAGAPTSYEARYRRLKEAAVAFEQDQRASQNKAIDLAFSAYRRGDVTKAQELLSDSGVSMQRFREFVKKQNQDPYLRITNLILKGQRGDFEEDYL